MNLLEIVNLKTLFPTPYGIVRAVDRIDLLIREKETFGLVGETGCGKTVQSIRIRMRYCLPPRWSRRWDKENG